MSSKYIVITTIGMSGIFLINYFYASIKEIILKKFNLKDNKAVASRIKLLENEVNELHETLDTLEEKVLNLENKLETKERETSELHQSNIDLNNKLDSFITYNYEVL